MDRLEKKIGWMAFPGLIRIIAGFQFLVFILAMLTQTEDGFVLLSKLELDMSAILKGEVWRLVSYLFIPRVMSAWWILFSVMFLWMVSDGLEAAWGVFKVNVFVFLGMVGATLGALFLGAAATGGFLFSYIILACCVLNPTHQIYFMLFIPMTLRVLGFIIAFGLVFSAVSGAMGGAYQIPLAVLCSGLGFFLFIVPDFVRRKKMEAGAAERRRKFAAEAPGSEGAFHTCVTCGATENDDAELDFRVAADGEEYCANCRPPKVEEKETDLKA